MTGPLPLTAGRWVTLAIGVPVALALIAWTGLNLVALAGVGSYRVNLTVPVHGRAVVQGGAADVSVSPGQPGRIRVTGAVRYSLVRPDITWRRGPSSVTFHSGCDFPAGECSIRLAVTVPPGGTPAVTLGSGDVTARGLSGRVTLSSASGNVNATGITGRSAISASSGDVVVTALSGPRAVLRDDFGDITGTGVTSPDVTVSDQSGDITLTFSAVPDQVQVSNAYGNVTLVLPPGATAYRISAVTSFGTTSIGVPRSTASRHVITVTDQSGDITISR
jgi:hypothetical protein